MAGRQNGPAVRFGGGPEVKIKEGQRRFRVDAAEGSCRTEAGEPREAMWTERLKAG